MNKKLAAYIIVPAVALSLLGAGVASAHGWFGFGNATPEEIADRQESMFERKADILGLSVEGVKDSWAQGKTFWEIAEENGITKEQLKERMKEQKEEQMRIRLQTLVDRGVITQAQADQRSQSIQNSGDGGGFRRGFHRGFGSFGKE